MSERATIQQVVQIGVETTAGVAVPATKKLAAMGLEASPQVEVATFKPQGTKFVTITSLSKEWVEADISGQLTYTEGIYPFASCFGNKVITPSGAGYIWTFEPRSGRADVVDTFTIQVGNNERAYRYTNGLVQELGIAFSRDGVELSGTMLGRAIEDPVYLDPNETYSLTASPTPPTAGTFTLTKNGDTTTPIPYNAVASAVQAALEALASIGTGNVVVVASPENTGAGNLTVIGNSYAIIFVGTLGQSPVTMTGTFTALTPASSVLLANPLDGAPATQAELIPVQPTECAVFVSDAPAGPWDETTQLSRVISAELTMSDRFGPVYTLDRRTGTSFITHVETEPTAEIELVMQADSEGSDFLAQMRDGATRYLRIDAIGPVIAGALRYSMAIVAAVRVTEHGGFSDEDGVYAATYTLSVVDDAAWGHAIQATLTNDIAAL